MPNNDDSAKLAPSDEVAALRIWDANLNRALEAMRVCEDYLRLSLGDAHLASQAKSLRHDLALAARRSGRPNRLAARDTAGDVGTNVSTATELHRDTLEDVFGANLRRATEALRCLEEYGKTLGPDAKQLWAPLRYRLYTLEKAVAATRRGQLALADAAIYVLLPGGGSGDDFQRLAHRAIASGADALQFRAKALSDRQALDRGRLARELARRAGKLFIMNDRPDLALLVDADGVHLGQDDLPVIEARRVMGPNRLVGVSTHSLAQAEQAVLDGADYIGVGPTFPSRTKQFNQFTGVALVREVSQRVGLPAFVIGGVSLANVEQVAAAGGARVAVCEAVCQAADDEQAAAVVSQMRAALLNPRPAR